WKSGTCHVLLARVAYVARPAATSRFGEAFAAKKSTLTTLNQMSGSATANRPDMSKQRPIRSRLTLKWRSTEGARPGRRQRYSPALICPMDLVTAQPRDRAS